MKNRTTLLYAVFIALIVIIILMFIPYPGQDELTNNEQPPTQQDPGQQQNFNPDYGDLTDEQIVVADRAIGELLNSVGGLNPSMITVKSIEAREFSNTALGCPQPDQMYAEVITPGYQVILEAQGMEYDYRLDTDDTVLLCEG